MMPVACISRTRLHEIPAEMGIVRIHAHAIFSTMVQLRALSRLAAPTPMMDEEILWVVETGMPSAEAMPMTTAELVSAAKP
ncbi:MAG: hypothetical protein RLZZ536_2710 [Planctomycetota bacterium]